MNTSQKIRQESLTAYQERKVLMLVNKGSERHLITVLTAWVKSHRFFDDQVAKHVSKSVSRLQDNMKAQILDPLELIPIIGFSHSFNLTCDSIRNQEKAAVWVFPYLMEESSAASLAAPSLIKATLSH